MISGNRESSMTAVICVPICSSALGVRSYPFDAAYEVTESSSASVVACAPSGLWIVCTTTLAKPLEVVTRPVLVHTKTAANQATMARAAAMAAVTRRGPDLRFADLRTP